MSIYKNLCLIPAKAASTRLKKKNILKINGKELIYYPLRAAKESNLFRDKVFVSTESEEIKQIAEKYGAKVHLRDPKLAHDPCGVVDVTLEFLDKNPEYKEYNNIFILLPTFPMILAKDIINSFAIYKKANFKYLMSVTETQHNAFRAILVKENQLEPIFKDKILKRTQELEKTYRVNGAITIMDVKDFLKSKSYYTFPVGTYIMPKERSIDIDTEFDYKLAKTIMENKEIFKEWVNKN